MSARDRRRGDKAGATRDSFERESFEEGVSAEELFGSTSTSTSRRRASAAHKDEQLCEQVFQILTYAMADLGDGVLRELAVDSVHPGLDGGRLVVTLVSASGELAVLADVHERLARSKGRLRSEIAGGVHRKRTPELTFRVVTREEVER